MKLIPRFALLGALFLFTPAVLLADDAPAPQADAVELPAADAVNETATEAQTTETETVAACGDESKVLEIGLERIDLGVDTLAASCCIDECRRDRDCDFVCGGKGTGACIQVNSCCRECACTM